MQPLYRCRCSSLGEIMGDAQSIDPRYLTEELAVISRKKTKSDEEKALLAPLKEKSLSAGAKTFLETVAKELVYGYSYVPTSKYMEKGTMVENESIKLYNAVNFTSHAKNTERRTNEWITGECDIDTGRKIIDIKSSWSLPTFPAIRMSGHDNGYEWQLRGYMMLWERDEAELAYCMVNTPDELVGYEDPVLHYVNHIPAEMRVTTIQYRRDLALEERIKVKAAAANQYVIETMQRIAAEHGV